MAKIRNEVLDQLAGEVLPERTVLSAVPMDGGSGFNFCSPNTQSLGVSGSILGFATGANQCGIDNSSHATGIGEIEI